MPYVNIRRRNGYPEASAREVASRLPQGLELDDS